MDHLTVNINDLTIEEVEVIEDVTGLAIDQAFKPGTPRGKVLRALAYVSRRREDPDFTLEDAGKLKLQATNEDPDPT